MAVLGEIRRRPWVLIGFIAIALLAFLVNPESINKVFGKNPNIMGKVNGEEITRDEYNDQLMMMQQQAQQQGQPTEGLEEQAWQTLVQSKLIKQQFEKMGLSLTDDFFWNQLQFDPMFAQNPQNFDAKGNFKTQEIKKQIESLKESGNVEQYNAWLRVRKGIEYRMMARQLFANVSNGVTANKKEAAEIIKQRDEVANIDFVKVDYTAFAQKNPVKVTTQDLADFIKKHPVMFKAQASRNLGIVHFPAAPSEADKNITLSEINKLLTQGVDNGNGLESFQNTKNDSMFVTINSETGYNPQYFTKEQLPAGIRDKVATAGTGQIFGPYEEQNYYVVSKILAKKPMDSTQSKHILISYKGLETAQGEAAKRSKEEAKKLADQIFADVKANPAKFNEYLKLSADGSSANGGDVGWTTTAQPKFVPEFQRFVDQSPKGATGLVETQFGYHIINITDKKSGAMTYKVANLTKAIKASDATTSKIHNTSTSFIQQVQGKSFNEFVNLAKKNNYNFQNPKMVQRFQGTLQGIGTDKDVEILKWAFDKKREKGDSDIFTASNGDRIVVYLNGKQEAGIADPESVREQIEPLVKNQLLAKKITEKITTAKATTLDQVAKLFGTQKESGQINLLNPNIGMAMEPKVAGAAFGVGINKVSQPIEGTTGVYVVMKKGVTANKQPGDVKQIVDAMTQQNARMFGQAMMKSLQDNADIKDYRIEVYDKTEHANQ